MNVNLEQVEMLRERANVSFEEAKEALEKCNCDMLEALIYLERQNKIKPPQKESCDHGVSSSFKNFMKSIGRLIKKGNEVKFVIKKEEDIIVKLPVNIIILITIIMPPITIIGILAALITHHKIKLEKPGCDDMEINKTFDKLSTAVTTASSHVADEINKE